MISQPFHAINLFFFFFSFIFLLVLSLFSTWLIRKYLLYFVFIQTSYTNKMNRICYLSKFSMNSINLCKYYESCFLFVKENRMNNNDRINPFIISDSSNNNVDTYVIKRVSVRWGKKFQILKCIFSSK